MLVRWLCLDWILILLYRCWLNWHRRSRCPRLGLNWNNSFSRISFAYIWIFIATLWWSFNLRGCRLFTISKICLYLRSLRLLWNKYLLAIIKLLLLSKINSSLKILLVICLLILSLLVATSWSILVFLLLLLILFFLWCYNLNDKWFFRNFDLQSILFNKFMMSPIYPIS